MGLKKTVTRIFKSPQLILMPMFSFWSYGPSRNFGMNEVIVMSHQYTWINIVLTILGSITYFLFIKINCIIFDLKCHLENEIFENVFTFMLYVGPIALLILGAILMILLQVIDIYSKNYPCCLCFVTNCTPVIQLTALDKNNFEVRNLEDYKQKEEFKMCLTIIDQQSHNTVTLISCKKL